MKEYKTYGELRMFGPAAVLEDIRRIVRMGEGEGHPSDKLDFLDYFGGRVKEVEAQEDLADIWTTREAPGGGRWLSIAEEADAFDDCRWLEGGDFAVVFNATTDSGGTTYYIPKDIVYANPTVSRSIALTKEAWGHEDYEEIPSDGRDQD